MATTSKTTKTRARRGAAPKLARRRGRPAKARSPRSNEEPDEAILAAGVDAPPDDDGDGDGDDDVSLDGVPDQEIAAAAEGSGASRAVADGAGGPVRRAQPANFLAMYFRDMAALEVLRPEEEFTAAREIEALDILVWERLLSYAPMVEHILGVVEANMDNSLTEFRALRKAAASARRQNTRKSRDQLAAAARRSGEAARAVDTDKQYLDAALAELGRIERGKSPRFGGRVTFSLRSKVFREYLRLVRSADRAASESRNDFVKANLRLVVSIARRFNHGRMALADLIQEGNIGLMKAVERYDYRRGFRFSTYASWWIRHAISRALADKGREVRLPVHMIDAQHRLAKARRELTARLGRQPSSAELAEATGLTADKIEKMRSYLIDQSLSLDKPVNDEEGRPLSEYLEDPGTTRDNALPELLAMQSLTDEMRRVMCELRPIEADILAKRFGLDDDRELTLKEIGEQYNLSRERIRQLQEQALGKMRRALERKEA
jgi:RNA polymerase primary sigma factor